MTWRAIREVLPNATYATPTSLLHAADKIGVRVDWLDRIEIKAEDSDSAVFEKLLRSVSVQGRIIVVTDFSFRQGATPFLFRGSGYPAFTDAYRQLTAERVISGADVVLVCIDSRSLVLYHHEGQIALVSGSK